MVIGKNILGRGKLTIGCGAGWCMQARMSLSIVYIIFVRNRLTVDWLNYSEYDKNYEEYFFVFNYKTEK